MNKEMREVPVREVVGELQERELEIMPLVPASDPILYRVATEVPYTKSMKHLLGSMYLTMKEKGGVGLAAPQVGVDARAVILTIDNAGNPLAIVNPVITARRGKKVAGLEGCLSYPSKRVKVYRYQIVTLKGYTYDWKPLKFKLRGLFARIAQHELDHLDGITISSRNYKEEVQEHG